MSCSRNTSAAGYGIAAGLAHARIELRHAGGSVSAKRSSSCCSTPRHLRCLARQLRKRLSHGRDQRRHELVEERLRSAQLVAVAHRAPDDPAQHVAAAFIRGHDAVDDEKAAGADVISDHPQRGRIELARCR